MKDTTMAWQRSSFCATSGCIEVAQIDGTIRLRDSKNPGQPPLVFTQAEWSGFQDLVLSYEKSS
ncbi:hypothetical protein GCM10010112_29470 [Actinoplanes lobatus]|uniref:DUF397 domain-containing protein n=3 Tax=Actinoplanes TaxID=1865 RepID=A0A7W5AEW9_9ACTN|nr:MULTISPECIES: DUF397 domain-containing protein [Actinoplanes]MBB3094953.1 hypothetical protein [Actinoplanes campanulatus]MBB4754656.1 hypothetical protein [Actinoplanes lobatus]MBW6435512.1 DUF397 domain-containing protein [Actinoplanes hulinensis]GGN08536.1 hypothetical protein GCM10010109_17420 [Actinoplanes campanulatus]GGN66738.1 hypothetical protein GCM10010112_29470 [Actinoplanes lobatus]